MHSFFWKNMMKQGKQGEEESRSSAEGRPKRGSNRASLSNHQREVHRRHREQTLKDYQIMIEYKHLKQHVPQGVYILPSFDSMRSWCGVIFLRAGFWKSGIFRFSIEMPSNYPGDDARPIIKFLNQVYHPLIDYTTGQVDLESRFPEWVAGKHYVLFCLKFLKQIFYLPQSTTEDGKFILQLIEEGKCLNKEATRLWLTDKPQFMQRASECAEISLRSEKLYSKEIDSSFQFSIFSDAHETIRHHVLKTGSAHGFQHASPTKSAKSQDVLSSSIKTTETPEKSTAASPATDLNKYN